MGSLSISSALTLSLAPRHGGGGTPSEPSYIGPELTPQASATAFPIQPLLTTNAYHPVGAKLRVRVASTYANLAAGASLLINDASITLTANATTNQNALWALLAGYSSGTHWIDVRVEESSTVFSERSLPIKHGSATVPAPVGSLDFDVYSTFALDGAIQFAEPIYATLTGDDALQLELSGIAPGSDAPMPGQLFQLHFLDNGTRTFGAQGSQALNDIYSFGLRVVDCAGNVAIYDGTAEVLDYDTIPDTPVFTPVTGATLSATTTSNTITIAGLAIGYVGNGTISGGTYSKNGGAYSSAPFTYTNGDTFALRRNASASYSTPVTVTFLGATWTITTVADPSVLEMLFRQGGSQAAGFDTYAPFTGITTYSGKKHVVMLETLAGPAPPATLALDGVSMTMRASVVVSSNTISVWDCVITTGGTGKSLVAAGGGDAFAYSLWTTDSAATFVASQNKPWSAGPDPQVTPSITMPTNGAIVCAALVSYTDITPAGSALEDFKAMHIGNNDATMWFGHMTATGAFTVNGPGYSDSTLLAASYQP